MEEEDTPDAKRPCTETSHHLSNSHKKLRAIVIALCCHHRCTWPQLAGTEWLRECGFTPHDVHILIKMTSWAVCGVRPLEHDEHYMEHDSITPPETQQPNITMTTSSTKSPPSEPHSDKADDTNVTKTTDSTHSITMTTGSTQHPHHETHFDKDDLIPIATDSTHSNITTATGSTHYPPSYHPHPREAVGIKCKRLLDYARLQYLKERGMTGQLAYFVSRGTSLENVLLIATPQTTNS